MFETIKEIQDFEWENISMTRQTLDLTPIGLKNNFFISPQKNGKGNSPFHHRKMKNRISPFHHRNMKKSN